MNAKYTMNGPKALSFMLGVLMLLSLVSCKEARVPQDVAGFTNQLIDGAGLTVEELGEKLGEELAPAGEGGVYTLKEPKNWEGGEYTVLVNAAPRETEINVRGQKKRVPADTVINFTYWWAPAGLNGEQTDSLQKLTEKLTEAYGEPAGYEEIGAYGDLAVAYTPGEMADLISGGKPCVYMQDWQTESGYRLMLKAQYDPSSPSSYPEGGPFWVRIDIRP